MYNRILQGFSSEGMLKEGRRCGGEEIGSDSSAERCKVLQWPANLPDLGRLVFCALIEEGESSFGLTFQAAWATATGGNPNTSINRQEGGGVGGDRKGWVDYISPYPPFSLHRRRPPPPVQTTGFSQEHTGTAERRLRMERKQ